MQQRKHWKAALIVTSLLLGGGALAHAGARHAAEGCEHAQRHNQHERGMRHAIDHLTDLSANQRTQLEALFDHHRDARRALRDQHRDTRRALRDAFKEGAQPSAVEPLAEQMGALSTQRILLRAQMRRDLAGILMPTQLEQLADWREQRTKAHAGGRGEW